MKSVGVAFCICLAAFDCRAQDSSLGLSLKYYGPRDHLVRQLVVCDSEEAGGEAARQWLPRYDRQTMNLQVVAPSLLTALQADVKRLTADGSPLWMPFTSRASLQVDSVRLKPAGALRLLKQLKATSASDPQLIKAIGQLQDELGAWDGTEPDSHFAGVTLESQGAPAIVIADSEAGAAVLRARLKSQPVHVHVVEKTLLPALYQPVAFNLGSEAGPGEKRVSVTHATWRGAWPLQVKATDALMMIDDLAAESNKVVAVRDDLRAFREAVGKASGEEPMMGLTFEYLGQQDVPVWSVAVSDSKARLERLTTELQYREKNARTVDEHLVDSGLLASLVAEARKQGALPDNQSKYSYDRFIVRVIDGHRREELRLRDGAVARLLDLFQKMCGEHDEHPGPNSVRHSQSLYETFQDLRWNVASDDEHNRRLEEDKAAR
jgi:hypothetical protein